MVDFAPGMRTIIRDEEWMIKKIETNSLGNKTLYCVGVSPLVKDREAIFLADLEQIQVVDPAEVKLVADHSPFYKRALLYLESQWRQQIPTDSNLHIGHRAAMDLMPYQLDPAKLSLQRPRQRILIADTVGLGKTLEAGILMSELIARGKGKRILVVTVKSMMTQFQKEMWNRFTIPLVRLDSNRIQKIRANLPSNYNPFFYYNKTIISIDTLKRDVEYRTHLENAYWDIIVIDEAQNVAERGDHQAQRSRLAKLLADRSDTMIMLSATPHDGRAKSFASLMNMLDPTAIADPENYTPEDIKGLCIRRFKKDVKDQVSGSFLERKITLERCHASAQEEYAFDIFTEMQLEMDLGKTKGTGQLFKTSLEKSLFSSPAACIKSIDARLKKLYQKYTADDIKDIRLLEELKTALEAITPAGFTRYQKLLELLRSKEYGWNPADTGDRVVIFTERIETMKYLAERLRLDLGLNANAIQEISGGMSDAEQQHIVEDFGRTELPVRVLVASDVASEGLNLHYLSHRLIHFDIPWSLMVFQQRNGRIDRYGQQKRPDIRYMLIESDNKRIKGDMRIIEILITKEEQALKNIGDPSLLLGKFTIEDEELVVAEAIEDGSNANAYFWQNICCSAVRKGCDWMAERVILAVAGAGKTYHICHEIDPTKRNLILAFTHENIFNIQKELCDAHGCVPELTTVSTFDSFVYHQLVLPYEPSIAEHFGCPKFVSRGICTVDPPPQTIRISFSHSVILSHKKSIGLPSFREDAARKRHPPWIYGKQTSCRLAEQTGQQRHEGNADQRHAAARHKLLHALRFYLCVIKKQ